MAKKILVVDDEPGLLEAQKLLLELSGYFVDAADDGKSALHFLQNETYDLIITDIIMQEIDGIALINHLRKLQPKPQIMAISGGGRIAADKHLIMAQELGADKILKKPVDQDELLENVKNLIGYPD